MAEDAEQEDRTHAATAHRLQRAREEGRVPLSRECVSLAGLALAVLSFAVVAPGIAWQLTRQLGLLLEQTHALDSSRGFGPVAWVAVWAWAKGAAPFVLAALIGGVAAVLLQTGFLVHPGALAPRFGALSPRAGLKRLFGVEGLAETLRSLAKLAAMAGAVWFAIGVDWRQFADLALLPVALLPAKLARMLLHVGVAVLMAQLVIAGADLAWVRFRHARQLRMSRQDIRDEQRETDGDPQIKARIKQIRTLRARKRMMAAVPRASVVITNPTHYAVALAYERGKQAAPRVVAKGVDEMAARIREIARAHDVPLVSNPPLARALHRVELDAEIPVEHFKAVAEIFAYIWRLNRRVTAGAVR